MNYTYGTTSNVWDELTKSLRYVDEALYPKLPVSSYYGLFNNKPKIKKVIFNDPATIIYWEDKSKTVVKCQNGEPFDPEKGFVMAYLKKLLGNDNTFNKEIHKWVKE